ncbi:AP-3 complex subunit sigma [Intoshia linei]|uniref:AP complex subunit sigma n=1 Tax=Intoshia linei TaxID=1819745 RepID=A0A177B069_9BILA|nr:AP-3 complex subunit sigma [Intoshia linei]
MIHAIFLFNNQGRPRLTKFYKYYSVEKQQKAIKTVYSHVSKRSDISCNFLENVNIFEDIESKLVYRHYATLYFVFVIDSCESELGILDLIQVFVEILDKIFENVCELDIIYNLDKIHSIISEMIIGGMVMQTNMSEIICRLDQVRLLEQNDEKVLSPSRAISSIKDLNITKKIKTKFNDLSRKF